MYIYIYIYICIYIHIHIYIYMYVYIYIYKVPLPRQVAARGHFAYGPDRSVEMHMRALCISLFSEGVL